MQILTQWMAVANLLGVVWLAASQAQEIFDYGYAHTVENMSSFAPLTK